MEIPSVEGEPGRDDEGFEDPIPEIMDNGQKMILEFLHQRGGGGMAVEGLAVQAADLAAPPPLQARQLLRTRQVLKLI